MFRTWCISAYVFVVTLPDRLYPFSCLIDGKRVRGRLSYEAARARAQLIRGPGAYGYRILAYRQVFHVLGSILFIGIATFVSHRLFGSETALFVLFAAAVLVISIQEFYLHPRFYEQHFAKGMSDWLAWVMPIGMYLFFSGF